jgi:hypothetical protein
LSCEVGASEALARPLHREAELMKQPRNVLRVVVHAELLLDPLADKRSSPHPRLKTGGLRTGFDDTRDFRALLIAQSRRATGQQSGTQAVSPFRVVPTDPFRDGRTVDAHLLGQVDGAAPFHVAQHALCAPPHRQVLQNRRFTQ